MLLRVHTWLNQRICESESSGPALILFWFMPFYTPRQTLLSRLRRLPWRVQDVQSGISANPHQDGRSRRYSNHACINNTRSHYPHHLPWLPFLCPQHRESLYITNRTILQHQKRYPSRFFPSSRLPTTARLISSLPPSTSMIRQET